MHLITNIEEKDPIYQTIKKNNIEGMDPRIVKTMREFIKTADDPRRDTVPQNHHDCFTIACAEEILNWFKEKKEHAKGDIQAYKWACSQMGMKEDFSIYS